MKIKLTPIRIIEILYARFAFSSTFGSLGVW